jgi:hypothetical protein
MIPSLLPNGAEGAATSMLQIMGENGGNRSDAGHNSGILLAKL